MTIQRTILKKDKNLFIIKLNLDTDDFIPEHHSSTHVTASVISGSGVFTVGNESRKISQGSFLDMEPFEKHSIKALDKLELIVHHITLSTEKQNNKDKICGLHEV